MPLLALSRPLRTAPLQAAAVFLAALGIYAGTLHNGFVYDDIPLLLENPWIRSWGALGEAFRQPLFAFHEYAAEHDPSSGYYRPLAHVVFWLHRELFGERPWGYHLGLALLHALTSVGVLRLLRLALARPRPPGPVEQGAAFFGALLFALHPVHTEAVAWVSGWMDVGASAGLLFAVLLLRPERASPLRAALAGLCWLAALLLKETALVLPVLLAFTWRGSPEQPHAWRARPWRYLPLVAALALYVGLRLWALGTALPAGPAGAGPLYWLDVLGLVSDLGTKLLWPSPLLVVPPHGPVRSLLELRGLAGAGIVGAGVALAVAGFRRSPPLFTGLLWLAVPLVPVALLQLRGVDAYAERYLYLPSVGFVLLVAVALRAALAQRAVPGPVLAAAGAVILLAAGAATAARVRTWRDDITLWEDTVAKVPQSPVARARLGTAYLKARRPAEARAQLELALRAFPRSAQVLSDLGVAHAMAGEPQRAVQVLEQAARYHPDSAVLHHNLGLALRRTARLEEAISSFQRATQLAPQRADSHLELGRSLLQAGRPAEAMEHLTRAQQLSPESEQIRRNLERARKALDGASR